MKFLNYLLTYIFLLTLTVPFSLAQPVDLNQYNDAPLKQFTTWFSKIKTSDSHMELAVLSTIDLQGKPIGHMMQVRQITSEGFIFYTKPQSCKVSELKKNPHASLTFFWFDNVSQISYQAIIQGQAAPYHPTAENWKEGNEWRTFILKPTNIQFSKFTTLKNKTIIGEYVEYVLKNGAWIKKELNSSLNSCEHKS